jgi:flagellar biosynthesis protein
MSKESIAIALEYGQNEAPVVTATGRGELAKKIIEAARQAGVPIHRDEDLTALLAMLEMEQEIPESLYRVVAEVLAYSYWIRGMKPGDEKRNSE